jgi:hypothetical protein
MGQSKAIHYYGEVYDSPFRNFRMSKHYHTIQRIAEFCEHRGTNEFTFQEFAAENPDIRKRRAQLFGAIERATGALCKTGETAKSSRGNCRSKIIVWRLCVPGAGAKSDSERIA